MTLIPWDPIRDLAQWRNEMNRLWEQAISKGGDADYMTACLQGPRVDVYQTPEEVVCSAEIPGIEFKEQLDVKVTQNTISIKGDHKRGSETLEGNYHHSERFYGTFSRVLTLPVEVNAEGSKATYKNGVLEVRIPKVTRGGGNAVKVDIN
jgi:HSP20 family protein